MNFTVERAGCQTPRARAYTYPNLAFPQVVAKLGKKCLKKLLWSFFEVGKHPKQTRMQHTGTAKAVSAASYFIGAQEQGFAPRFEKLPTLGNSFAIVGQPLPRLP